MRPPCCGWLRARSHGIERIAAALGADVPSQLEPTLALVEGSGELITPLPATGEWAAVLIPDRAG